MSTDRHDEPVFIGGIAGSGKTRLGALLGRHPDVAVTRKTYLWRNFYGRYGDLADPANTERCANAILASPGVQRLSFDRTRFDQEMKTPPRSYGELFALFHRLHAEAVGKSRWCDQLGLVEVYAEAIFAAFPRARMIHMVCDPRSPQFSEQRAGALGWTMGKWVTSAALAEQNVDRFDGRYLVVRYEDFQADEEQTLRGVCQFLGEPFHNFITDQPPGRQPAARRGTARGGRFIERCARDLMANHGYPVTDRSVGATLRDRIVDEPANRLALATWRQVKVRAISRQVGGAL